MSGQKIAVETIRKNFRVLIAQRSLTLKDVCGHAGVDYLKARRVLSSTNPTVGSVVMLAEMLGVQPWHLMKPSE